MFRASIRKYPFAAPLAACAGLVAVPALAADVQVAVQGPVVEISAAQTVQAAPDVAIIGAGVTTRAPTATQAMQQNAVAMDKVVARLRALGIAREDIQTVGISLSPRYTYNSEAPPTFIGYDAANQVSVKLRRIDKAGETLDALVVVGATDINGPQFQLEKDDAVRAQARKAAFEKARVQALGYAQMAGFTSLRLLEVSEAISGGAPVPYVRTMAMADSVVAKTPVEPGQVGTTVQVSVKYEMVK